MQLEDVKLMNCCSCFCSVRILFVTFWPVSVGFHNITPSLFWPQASFSKRFKHEGHAQPMQQMLRAYWKQRTSETLKSKARWRSEERIKIIYEIVMKLWHWSRQSAFSTSQQHGSLSRWIDWRTDLLGLWATWSWAMVPPKSAFPPEGTRPRHNKLHVETWSALFWVKRDGISKKTCPPSKSSARFGLKDDNFELGQELGGGSQGHRLTWHLWSFLSAKASFLLPVFSCFVTRAGRVFACKRLGTIIHRPLNLLHFSMINENHFEVSLDRPWLATCQHGWNCWQFLRLPLRRLGTGNEYAVKVRDNLCHCHSALHVFFCNLKPWSVSTCTGRACAAPFLCTCFIYRNFKIQTFNVKISKLMARPRLALQKIRSCWSCWFHQKWCNSHKTNIFRDFSLPFGSGGEHESHLSTRAHRGQFEVCRFDLAFWGLGLGFLVFRRYFSNGQAWNRCHAGVPNSEAEEILLNVRCRYWKHLWHG